MNGDKQGMLNDEGRPTRQQDGLVSRCGVSRPLQACQKPSGDMEDGFMKTANNMRYVARVKSPPHGCEDLTPEISLPQLAAIGGYSSVYQATRKPGSQPAHKVSDVSCGWKMALSNISGCRQGTSPAQCTKFECRKGA